jgi:hypothetical protein
VEWQIAQDKRERIVSALGHINLGDQKKDVLAMLGSPDEDRILVPKGIGLKPHGSAIKYQFAFYEQGLVNEKWDQYI